MNQKRIKALIGFMIVLQLVAMITKIEEWGVIKRIDKTTTEHSVVLASHSNKLDTILDFGFNTQTIQRMKEKHGIQP
jgi:hypothetical protein